MISLLVNLKSNKYKIKATEIPIYEYALCIALQKKQEMKNNAQEIFMTEIGKRSRGPIQNFRTKIIYKSNNTAIRASKQ